MNPKTAKKQLITAACMCLLLVAGCKKEAEREPVAAHIAKAVPCGPSRSVVGHVATCTELDGFAICSPPPCRNSLPVSILTSGNLADASAVDFAITSAQTVTVSLQNDILTAGRAWASANLPGGCYIQSIHFASYPFSLCCGGTISLAYIRVTVTYEMCA